MNVIRKEIYLDKTKKELYYEQFTSFEEYARIVENRQKTNAHDKSSDLDHIARNKSWSGVGSYDEAKKLLLNGWDSQVENIKTSFKKEVSELGNKNVIKICSDVVGFMPIVPNAIMGLPKSMLNQKSGTRKQRVVKFLILMNRSCGYSSEQIIEKMSKILARIAVLERKGVRCRIEVFGSFHDGNKNGTRVIPAHSILIKSENQLFDIKRVAFPMAHTAMQRVYGFSWENSLPIDYDSYHTYSLGRSCQYWREENRNALLDAINENNEKIVVLGMESDLDEVFSKIK